MAKATTVKEAIKKFEDENTCNAAEVEKVMQSTLEIASNFTIYVHIFRFFCVYLLWCLCDDPCTSVCICVSAPSVCDGIAKTQKSGA